MKDMKKKLICLLTFLIVSMIGFNFTSCSKNNDDSSSSIISESSILGTWKYVENQHEYNLITFKSGGKGYGEEWNYDEKTGGFYLKETWDFSYHYDPSKNELIINGVTAVVEISGNKMTLYNNEDGTMSILVKQ